MTLADRLNKIIEEHGISKAEFARRVGISENYIYQLTGRQAKTLNSISSSLVKLIALEFQCDEDWIINGDR